MATGISANRLELLQIADAVAREKSIEKEIVIAAIEEAIQKAARARYGAEHDIRASHRSQDRRIDRHPCGDRGRAGGERRHRDFPGRRPEARQGRGDRHGVLRGPAALRVRRCARPSASVSTRSSRTAWARSSTARSSASNTATSSSTWAGARGIMRRDQSIPRENFQIGDRIRSYIYDVRTETKGPQIMLSRAHGGFMASCSRRKCRSLRRRHRDPRRGPRPGSRAKMAVVSNDSSIDPVGACVGMRGSRVQAVVAELQGEKIDIIQWSPDEPTFIVNGLAPAEVTKVVMDEEEERVEVVVPDEQLSLAIGRRGQNVRLASQLTGWQIDIMTESQESERRQREFAERTALFQEALDVDEVIAQLLVTEGFAAVEDVAYVEPDEIAQIEGFDEDTAEELQARAPRIPRQGSRRTGRQAPRAGRGGRPAGDRGRDPADRRGAGDRGHQDGGEPRRPGARRPARLVRDQERRARAPAGGAGDLQHVGRGRRGPDHAGPRGHGLDRGRSRT